MAGGGQQTASNGFISIWRLRHSKTKPKGTDCTQKKSNAQRKICSTIARFHNRKQWTYYSVTESLYLKNRVIFGMNFYRYYQSLVAVRFCKMESVEMSFRGVILPENLPVTCSRHQCQSQQPVITRLSNLPLICWGHQCPYRNCNKVAIKLQYVAIICKACS